MMYTTLASRLNKTNPARVRGQGGQCEQLAIEDQGHEEQAVFRPLLGAHGFEQGGEDRHCVMIA